MTHDRQSSTDESFRTLIGEDQIRQRIAELAAELNHDYAGKELLLVGVLKGAIIFMVDLARAIQVPLSLDFMAVSSYGDGTQSSGVVRIIKDLEENVEGKHVLVVEDIIDTGLTLTYVLQSISARNPASLKVCAFLRKQKAQQIAVPVDYVAFDIPDVFVIGYGLDYAERNRNIPYVAVWEGETAADIK